MRDVFVGVDDGMVDNVADSELESEGAGDSEDDSAVARSYGAVVPR